MLSHQIRDLLFHLKKSCQNLFFPDLRPETFETWILQCRVQNSSRLPVTASTLTTLTGDFSP